MSVRTNPLLACYLCGGAGDVLFSGFRDRLFEAPGEWSLRRCANPNCGLVWLDPMPVREDIGKLYESYLTHGFEDEELSQTDRFRQAFTWGVLAQAGFERDALVAHGSLERVGKAVGRAAAILRPCRESARGRVMWLDPRWHGRLLDVGCGNGKFLATMKRAGWEVLGIDPNPNSLVIARDHFKVAVIQGVVEDAGLPADHFNAITLDNVIEHLPDPVATLTACRRILAPGGHIVVATPNVQSRGAGQFGRAWVGWDPPRHLYLFTPATLRSCAQRAGLQVVSVGTSGRSAHWISMASQLIKRDGRIEQGWIRDPKPSVRLRAAAFWTRQCLEGWRRPHGEEVILIAAKGL